MYFAFAVCAFGILSETNPKVSIATWRFTILGLIVVSLLCFNFCVWYKNPFYYFCMGLIQFSQYKLLKDYIFSTLCIYSSLVED